MRLHDFLALSATLCLSMGSASSYADCEKAYLSALRELDTKIEATYGSAGMGSAIAIGAVTASTLSGMASFSLGAASAAYMSTEIHALSKDRHDLRQALAVLSQAKLGDGIELRRFHSMLSKEEGLQPLSLSDLIEVINEEDADGALCRKQSLRLPELSKEIMDKLALKRRSAF